MAATQVENALPHLKNYAVLEKVGEGSMASVYRGTRRDDGLPVAIKVPLPTVVSNPTLRERFLQEFRVGNTLDHVNLVKTLDFGQEGETYYLVMEFVEGEDLWQRIERTGRLPEAEAVDVITKAAHGLHEAHKHGVIHRDIKPDNILLSADGGVKLADLGLIKDLEGELQLTCTQKGLGTPNFIAPEQFSEARHATVRCDIYGLGATLYMAVTGELPFAGRSMGAMLRKKMANDLISPRKLVKNLSERLEWTIRRAVQSDPQRRHSSCLEFVQALTGADAGAAQSIAPSLEAKMQRAPGRERRRHLRYACTRATICDMTASIHPDDDGLLDQWEATVQDLSVAGIGLVLNRRFEPGTFVKVLLESPDRSHQRSAQLQVVRVRRVRNGHWFIGGSFTAPLEKEELVKLL